MSLLHAKFKEAGFMAALWQEKSLDALLNEHLLREKLDLIFISAFMNDEDVEKAAKRFLRGLHERRLAAYRSMR